MQELMLSHKTYDTKIKSVQKLSIKTATLANVP